MGKAKMKMRKENQMSNSPLINGTRLSSNHSGRRTQPITKIAIHHASGVIGGWNLASVFIPKSRRASANYNLGSDGVLILGVDEANRAWTTSSNWCDQRAVTIEVGNSTRGPRWMISDSVMKKLIDLCVDICWRNHIYPCTYTGNSSGTLQMHKWYSNTDCPGPYLASKFSYIANEVTRRLTEKRKGKPSTPSAPSKPASATSGNLYKVIANALNVRSGPSTDYRINTTVKKNEIYTIVEIRNDWGRLKSGAGWVYMGYMAPYNKKPSTPVNNSIKVGDKVKILGGKYSTGQTIPRWVLNEYHIVSSVKSDKVLLGHPNGINSWVPKANVRRIR